MSMTDPMADLLTRIRNAVRAGHSSVEIPGSKLKESVVGILKSQGYIRGYDVEPGPTDRPGSRWRSSRPRTASWC